jgi:hypothetical protein
LLLRIHVIRLGPFEISHFNLLNFNYKFNVRKG